MKPAKLILFAVIFILVSCSGGNNSSEVSNEKIDSLTNLLAQKEATIIQLRDTVSMLQYPASQRLDNIKQLIAENNFDAAKNQITELQKIFPNSTETSECNSLTQTINTKIAEIEAEKQRIKALGFKALKVESKVVVDYNTVTFNNISIDKEFIHDVYGTYSGSQWYYNTADRGNKFITAAMSVNSTSKDPEIPTLAFYNINGENLELQGTFRIEMARWDDYGTYLGNYNDNNNDFSKVSTVKFKLGCELPEEDFAKPYVVVLKKSNTQSRHYNRFANPPISYSGSAGYPQILKLDNFTDGDYVAIKVANL